MAVCATALPVDVQLEPSPPLQFGATPTMSPTTQHVKVYLPLVHLFSVSQLEKNTARHYSSTLGDVLYIHR